MKNKIKNRIPHYKLRQKALKRANYRCERCGETHNLHMHHIRYPGTSLDDVVILCSYCHYLTHYGHPPNTKKITKEKVEALCKEGKSLREIASVFQTSYETIRQRLIYWGLKTIGRKHKRKKHKIVKTTRRRRYVAVGFDFDVLVKLREIAYSRNTTVTKLIENIIVKEIKGGKKWT